MTAKAPLQNKTVETIIHDESKRKNIPTAEHQSVIKQNEKNPIKIKYPRNTDIDPQLVWRGKDEQDWSDLIVNAPPLYIQEKVHPKALIDDLLKQTKKEEHDAGMNTADLFADFDGIPKDVDKTEFYAHDQNWSNRMILGDSLQVMASLADREGLRGQVQCIFFDPPYGIKFNSNFQWSTTSRDVKDGKAEHITREPEQVKAFRDTWRDGIHSYLTYLRDRLTVARTLLSESGSIFVQIGDENVHRVRALLDEVFGDKNFVAEIILRKTGALPSETIASIFDIILWYSKDRDHLKSRNLYLPKGSSNSLQKGYDYIETQDNQRSRLTAEQRESIASLSNEARFFSSVSLESAGWSENGSKTYEFNEQIYNPRPNAHWKTHFLGLDRLGKSNRILSAGNSLRYVMYLDDFPALPLTNIWDDLMGATALTYVVQTNTKIVQRCILMASDPGDLVLDPTCGSGTTAYVSEYWGRRWITIDTSRVSLALARARLMGAKYPQFLLKDSNEGQKKEAEALGIPLTLKQVTKNIKQGFVYERVPHVTLKSIANNVEIDVIYEKYQIEIENNLNDLNNLLNKKYKLWQIPFTANEDWSDKALNTHKKLINLVQLRIAEINNSIAAKADFENLFDKPYEDKKKVRVAGPFTVDSLSPHRILGIDENDNLIDSPTFEHQISKQTFTQMILENLKISGVQQAHKENKILFSSLMPWPGNLICAEGRYFEGNEENKENKRAAIFIGPEFGTVQRADLVEAAREAGDAGFDSVIACAFNFEAHATELNKLGNIPILKARMNADLHMSEDLKNTGKGNLFVIFGEPDIDLIHESNDQIKIKVNGVDVFKPQTGEVVSDGADGIACWFIDTDYNEESFFVRQAYFLGANDPYNSLKTTLKAEINLEAWASLNSDTSRLFSKPKSGRIAVKVINHLGDEVMKVFKV